MRCRGKSANISSLLYRQYAHSVYKSLSKWMRFLDRNAVNRGRRLGSSRQWGSTACRASGKWQTSSSRTTSICLFMYAKVTQWDGTCSLLDGLVWCWGVRSLLLTSYIPTDGSDRTSGKRVLAPGQQHWGGRHCRVRRWHQLQGSRQWISC